MPARILIVDDDPDYRAVLCAFLRSKSHEVLEAADGAQAFAVAEAEMPHLIIMDIIMPGVYGSAASKRLQEYWRTSRIPILIISGTTDAPVRKIIEANPKLRFLKKPVEPAVLEAAVREMLPLGGFSP